MNIETASLKSEGFYRPVMEDDVADWAAPSRWAWYVVLPLLQVSCLLLKPGLNPRQRWIPFIIFQIWIVATAVHLRCVDYICDLALQPGLLAPLLWTAAWTLVLKAPASSFIGRWWPCWPTVALIPALGSHDSFILTALSAANALLLIGVSLARKNQLAAALAWVSLILAAMSVPPPAALLADLTPTASHPRLWLAGAALAMAGCGLMSRRLFLALLGACALQLAPFGLSMSQPVNYSLQLGLAYLLLHGLLWCHRPGRPTLILQFALAGLIVLHGFAWVHYAPGQAAPFLLCEGLLLCVACAAVYWTTGRLAPWRLALPGPLLLTAPLTPYIERFLQASPKGLLILGISFLIFGLGTLLALRKKPVE